MAPRPLSELVDASWLPALEPQAGAIAAIGTFLRAEIAAGRGYLPPVRTCFARSTPRWTQCEC